MYLYREWRIHLISTSAVRSTPAFPLNPVLQSHEFKKKFNKIQLIILMRSAILFLNRYLPRARSRPRACATRGKPPTYLDEEMQQFTKRRVTGDELQSRDSSHFRVVDAFFFGFLNLRFAASQFAR